MSAEELVDLNAERAVLGAALLEQSAVEAALDLLRADQFADARHRIVFGAVADLAKENEPVDILTVRSRLEHAGLLGEVGGPAFLTTLTEEITTAANVRHYAKLVGESWLRREIVDAAKAGTSAAELRYRIEKAIIEATALEGSYVALSSTPRPGPSRPRSSSGNRPTVPICCAPRETGPATCPPRSSACSLPLAQSARAGRSCCSRSRLRPGASGSASRWR
jgi:hypothetical protein